MQWPQFAERLAATLSRLATDARASGLDATVVIYQATQQSAYVQFIVYDDGVHAEVSSGRKFLPKDLRLSPEALRTLLNTGWNNPPKIQRGQNLECHVDPPTDESCATLANQCVVALRDVWRVPDPHSLMYRAFQTDTQDDLILHDLGLSHESSS